MKPNKTDENNYLDKLLEWQEHQYDPGYYTGGNIPPILTHTGRPKLLGWFWVISSIVLAIIMAVILKAVFKIEHIIHILFFVVFSYSIIIFQFISGVRLIKKAMLMSIGQQAFEILR